MFAYQSEVYCDSCGEAIKAILPTLKGDFDSDDFPKWAPSRMDWDYPPHCGSGPECLEAIALSCSGLKVGGDSRRFVTGWS